jgi:hypothetical protein
MRIASANVENLFARAKAMNTDSKPAGKSVLAAHAEVNQLFELRQDDTNHKSHHTRRCAHAEHVLLVSTRISETFEAPPTFFIEIVRFHGAGTAGLLTATGAPVDTLY